MDTHLNQQENIVPATHVPPVTSEELLESLQESSEYKRDIYRLSEVYQELFGTEYLGNYCCYAGGRQECSDGADLYTLIKYQGKDLIVKVGAGEFNTKVFTTGNIKELKGFYNSPIPLFVVNQGHSYLGDDEDKLLRKNKPKEYLDKYAVIVSPKGGDADYRSREERDMHINYGGIHIRQYDDALAVGRLALLQKTFPNGEFDTAVRLLKQLKKLDFEHFYSRTCKGEKFLSYEEKKLIGCLRNMGVNTVGSAVGDEKAYQSLYGLIQSFDIHKKSFTSLQPQHHE